MEGSSPSEAIENAAGGNHPGDAGPSASVAQSSLQKREQDDMQDEQQAEAGPSASPSAEVEQPRSKRVRKTTDDAAGRGKRMFGMLNATLGRAKREAENKKGEARQRASIQARQQEKLRVETERLESLEAVQKELRQACIRELALAEEIVSGDAAHRAMRSSKRRLASFLVTSSPAALEQEDIIRRRSRAHNGSARGSDVLSVRPETVVTPTVPAALPPRDLHSRRTPVLPPERAAREHAIYFLPRHLTAEQEDRLDDQEDAVDADIEEADREWATRKQALLAELEICKQKIVQAEEQVSARRVAGDQAEEGTKEESTEAGHFVRYDDPDGEDGARAKSVAADTHREGDEDMTPAKQAAPE